MGSPGQGARRATQDSPPQSRNRVNLGQIHLQSPGEGLTGLDSQALLCTSFPQPECPTVPSILTKLTALVALLGLAACADAPRSDAVPLPAEVPAEYQAVQDGEYLIPAVEPLHLFGTNARTEVDYAGSDSPGTIVVYTHARVL